MFKYDFSRDSESRFAVIVSKKISKKAVERNHLRRQTFAALRLHFKDETKAINCVIIPHKHILQFDYPEIEKQILHFFNNYTRQNNHSKKFTNNNYKKRVRSIQKS